RSAEQTHRRGVERARPPERFLAVDDEIFAAARAEAVIRGVADRALRARVGAIGAEQAAPEIDAEPFRIQAHRAGRTGVDARLAALLALRAVDDRKAAEPIGQRGRHVRIRAGPKPLLRSR